MEELGLIYTGMEHDPETGIPLLPLYDLPVDDNCLRLYAALWAHVFRDYPDRIDIGYLDARLREIAEFTTIIAIVWSEKGYITFSDRRETAHTILTMCEELKDHCEKRILEIPILQMRIPQKRYDNNPLDELQDIFLETNRRSFLGICIEEIMQQCVGWSYFTAVSPISVLSDDLYDGQIDKRKITLEMYDAIVGKMYDKLVKWAEMFYTGGIKFISVNPIRGTFNVAPGQDIIRGKDNIGRNEARKLISDNRAPLLITDVICDTMAGDSASDTISIYHEYARAHLAFKYGENDTFAILVKNNTEEADAEARRAIKDMNCSVLGESRPRNGRRENIFGAEHFNEFYCHVNLENGVRRWKYCGEDRRKDVLRSYHDHKIFEELSEILMALVYLREPPKYIRPNGYPHLLSPSSTMGGYEYVSRNIDDILFRLTDNTISVDATPYYYIHYYTSGFKNVDSNDMSQYMDMEDYRPDELEEVEKEIRLLRAMLGFPSNARIRHYPQNEEWGAKMMDIAGVCVENDNADNMVGALPEAIDKLEKFVKENGKYNLARGYRAGVPVEDLIA